MSKTTKGGRVGHAAKRKTAGQARRRKAILILGAHRSGTSALTRVLSLSGAGLPKSLMKATEMNSRGFFESQRIYALHERMLSELGSSWQDLAPLPGAWLESDLAGNFVEEMASLVREEFGKAPLFVLKDPRICRLVPFWLAVLEELDIEPLFVLPIRNPLEMADSLGKAESVDRQKGLLIWLNSVLHAEHGSRKFSRSIVEYDSLLSDWRSVLKKIGTDLGLSFPRVSRRAQAEIDEFLSSELRHHEVSTDELAARGDVLDWIKMTFEWMSLAASGKRVPTAKIDGLRLAFTEAERAFGPVLAGTELTRELSDAEAQDLRSEVVDLKAQRDRLEGEIVPLGDESEHLRTRLESREEQIGELINCIKLMLVWIASRAPGSKTSSEELQVLLQAMDTSDSDSIAETAMEGLRRYQTSVESSFGARGPAPRRMGLQGVSSATQGSLDGSSSLAGEAIDEALPELKSKNEALEEELEARGDQIRLVREQLEEKQGVLKQALAELVQSEEKIGEQGADQAALREKLGVAEGRVAELIRDVKRSEEGIGRETRRAEALSSEKMSLERRVEETGARLGLLESEKNALGTEKAVLQGEIDKLAGRAVELESEKNALGTEKAGLETEVDALRGKAAQLESDRISLDGQIRQLRERESVREEEIRKLQPQLLAAQERLELRETEIDTLQLRSRQLEEDRLRIRRQLSERDRELASFLNSRTWRMTLPLRRLGQFARKLGLRRVLGPISRVFGLRK